LSNVTVPPVSAYGGQFDSSLSATALHTPCTNQVSSTIAAQFAAAGQTLSTPDPTTGACSTANGAQAILKPFANNQIPTSLLDANAQALLKAGIFPAPTSGAQFIGGNNSPTNVREELARVDHQFTDGLGYLHWKMRQYDDAKREFEAELSVDPDHPQALAYLGDIEMKRNEPEKALPLLKKAVQLKNDIRIAYSDLGAIFLERKQYQDAMTALQRAVELDPAQPDAHFRLGRLYHSMGDTAAAQKEFSRVRELHEKEDEDVAAKMSGAPPPLASLGAARVTSQGWRRGANRKQ
jgi:tetratricopeptide (TPR) repeat protein